MQKPFRRGTPFVISAPSGAGKTSICKELRLQIPDLVYSVSYTTRSRRAREKEGEDYFYISSETFISMIAGDKFLEWAQVYGNYYGTSRQFVYKSIENGFDCLLDIDTQGAKKIKEICKDAVFIFILPPNIYELECRLSKRQTENQDQIRMRMRKAIFEIKAFEEYQYLIINEDFSKAIEELKSIIVAERAKTQKREALAFEILKSLQKTNTCL